MLFIKIVSTELKKIESMKISAEDGYLSEVFGLNDDFVLFLFASNM